MFVPFLFALTFLFVNGDQCTMENTLCSLCGQRSTLKNEELEALKKDIEDLKKQKAPVAFFAYMGSNMGTGSSLKHRTLIYDRVDLNLGNGYNKNTGKFTAPSDGLYLIHVVTGSYNRSYAAVELIQNGNIKDIGCPDSADHDDRNQVTTATPLYLKKGDVVYARIGEINGGNRIESDQYIRTSFSAVKIQ